MNDKNLPVPMQLKEIVYSTENKFSELCAIHGATNFKQEALFALQSLNSNDYLAKVSLQNKASLTSAVLNVAAIGLTLNPAQKLAYLVPRMGKVCLDISYIGLAKLATDSGAVAWVQAELVKERDEFVYNGVGKLPTHRMDPFSERGEVKGVFCVVRIATGEYLTTVMSLQECHAIRDRTEAYKAYASGKTKSCPWVTDEGEMLKKTVIRRASKLWPKSERLQQAIDAINEHEGINFAQEQNPVRERCVETVDYQKQNDLVDRIKAIINEKTEGMDLEAKANFLTDVVGIDNYGQLKKKSNEQLEELIEKIVE